MLSAALRFAGGVTIEAKLIAKAAESWAMSADFLPNVKTRRPAIGFTILRAI